ncbi:ribonuclease H-like domain-containing protein, partial [Candidatus Woesearchaeota archaeon]|nr:ribonuclease H-like domain-containing protein [Candidatus Woesearchaeota archaeon]
MANVQFFLTDISAAPEGEATTIALYGRTGEGRQLCVQETFLPYCYIIPHREPAEELQRAIMALRLTGEQPLRVLSTELLRKKYLGKDTPALKVIVNTPAALLALRDEMKHHPLVKEIVEYDIDMVKRYLVDKSIVPFSLLEAEGEYTNQRSKVSVMHATSVHPLGDEVYLSPKILAFDIETYTGEGTMIDMPRNPILMLACSGAGYEKVITWKRFDTSNPAIEFVADEAALLRRFTEIIEEQQPDILVGYYSDEFDFPYILTRARINKVKLELGLDYSTPFQRKGRASAIEVAGIAHIDLCKFIQRIVARNLDTESYSLNAVAAELLGEQKREVAIEHLGAAWDANAGLEEYCEYNLHDTRLTYRLMEKLLPNLVELMKVVGMPITDVNRMAYSQLVESYIIKQTPFFHELIPPKPHHQELQQRQLRSIQGAFVYEPTPGLYKNIVLFDYRSLYPSIISSHNIGPDTLRCSCCTDSQLAPLEGKAYYFCRKKRSFLSAIISDIITRRVRIKEMLKEEKNIFLAARSESLKLLANSFYGYLNFFAARWYSIESAEATTAYGRYYIKKVISAAQDAGFPVIYSDTDSVFLALEDKSEQDALRLAEKINAELPGVMELEYQGLHPQGIFVSAKMGRFGAKKRYALARKDGSLKIMGFESVRRNISFIAKEVQRQVLHIILLEGDNAKALEHVKSVIAGLRAKQIPNGKMVIYTQLQKRIEDYDQIGPHVAAARRMREKGLRVGPGTLVKYIIIEGKSMIRERARLPDEVQEKEYDAEYYINNQVIPAIEKIMEVIGYGREQLLGE